MHHRMTPATIISAAATLLLCSTAHADESVDLFDGKSLNGWDYFLLDDDAQMKDVWSVKDGLLICQGEPMGYLYTGKKFKDFKLKVVWRWAPDTKPGNSGVLMRITGDKNMMLPKCVEAQLKSGDAGDIWAFQGFQVTGDKERFRDVNHEKFGRLLGLAQIKGNEKEPGKWNTYEITLQGDKLTLVVNGEKLNEASGCDEVAGHIGLQSEGGEIHFKTVQLTPIK